MDPQALARQLSVSMTQVEGHGCWGAVSQYWANSRLLGLGPGEDAGADRRGCLAVSVRESLLDMASSCLQLLASNLHREPGVMRYHRPGLPLNPSPPPRTGGQLQSQPGQGAATAGVKDGPRTPGRSSTGKMKFQETHGTREGACFTIKHK